MHKCSHKATEYYLIDICIFTDRLQRNQFFTILSSGRCVIASLYFNTDSIPACNLHKTHGFSCFRLVFAVN